MAQLFPSSQNAIQGPNIVPQASRADGYYDPNFAAGPSQPNFLNLGPLSGALQEMFKIKGEVRAQNEAAQGAKAWADSPEARANFQAAQAGSSAEEATRTALAKEIKKGNIPVAASPHFQLAFAQQAAEGDMRGFRSAVLQRISEASQVSDSNDNPVAKVDPQTIIDEEWAKVADGVALNTGPGAQVAAGMYSRVQNEFVSRVTQETSVNQERFYVREYSRGAGSLVTEFEGGLAGGPMEPKDLQAFRRSVRAYALRDGGNANIKDVPGSTWAGLRDGILVLAETNPQRAQVLLTALEDTMVSDGGTARPLGQNADIRLDMARVSRDIVEMEDQESRRNAAASARHLDTLHQGLEHQGFTAIREAYDAGQDPLALLPELLDKKLTGVDGTMDSVLSSADDRAAAKIILTDYANSLSLTKDLDPELYRDLRESGQRGTLGLEELRSSLGQITPDHYDELEGYAKQSGDINGKLTAAGFGGQVDYSGSVLANQYTSATDTPPGLRSSQTILAQDASEEFLLFSRGLAPQYERGDPAFESALRAEDSRLRQKVREESLALEERYTGVIDTLAQMELDFVDTSAYLAANKDALGTARHREGVLANRANLDVSARVRADNVIKTEQTQAILDLVAGAEPSDQRGVTLAMARGGVADLHEELEDELRRLMAAGVTGTAQMEQLRAFGAEAAGRIQSRLAPAEKAKVERAAGKEGVSGKTAEAEGQAENNALDIFERFEEAQALGKVDNTLIAGMYFPQPLEGAAPVDPEYASMTADFLRGKIDREGNPRVTTQALDAARSEIAADIIFDAREANGGHPLTKAQLDALGTAVTVYHLNGGLSEAAMLTGRLTVGPKDPRTLADLKARGDALVARMSNPALSVGQQAATVASMNRISQQLRGQQVEVDKAQVNPFTTPFFTQGSVESWATSEARVTALMAAQVPPVSEERRQDFIDAQRAMAKAHNPHNN